jgi:glucokinase
MYLGIDIGGTKTLVACFDNDGNINQKIKFPTPRDYTDFIPELKKAIDNFNVQDFKAVGIGVPGTIDRQRGVSISQPNLPWKNAELAPDISKLIASPAILENDANLAGLSEALLHKEADVTVYITVSTGIGIGVISSGKLSKTMINSEGGHMILPHNGKLEEWEKFASGHAFYEHFGKYGSDVPASDTKTWGYFARNLSLGFHEIIAMIEPDLIIIGGSMGEHFNKYHNLLELELDKLSIPIVKRPQIIQASRPDDAVVYGCYDIVSQRFPKQ